MSNLRVPFADLASQVYNYQQQELEHGPTNLRLMRDEAGIKSYEVIHWELGRIGRIELQPRKTASILRSIPENYIPREEITRLISAPP